MVGAGSTDESRDGSDSKLSVGSGVDGSTGRTDGVVDRYVTEVLFESSRSLGDSLGIKVLEKALRRYGNSGNGTGDGTL